MRGDFAAAKDINQSFINSLRSISFVRGMQYAYSNLGRISLVLEELDEAELNYARCLRINQETGQIRDELSNLTNMAKVWKAQGRGAEAIEAVGAVLHRTDIDQNTITITLSIRDEAEALRSELERELDPDEYQTAWEKGSGEDVDDIVDRISGEHIT